jgi:hypothetical protein
MSMQHLFLSPKYCFLSGFSDVYNCCIILMS